MQFGVKFFCSGSQMIGSYMFVPIHKFKFSLYPSNHLIIRHNAKTKIHAHVSGSHVKDMLALYQVSLLLCICKCGMCVCACVCRCVCLYMCQCMYACTHAYVCLEANLKCCSSGTIFFLDIESLTSTWDS